MKPKHNPMNEDPQEQIILYGRVDDGDKFLSENIGLRKRRFHATSHLKIEAKVIFS